MIRLPSQEGESPIDLFQKEHPGHSVGQSHGGQGEAEVGLFLQGFFQSIGSAQDKSNFLGTRTAPFLQGTGKSLGGEKLSFLIQGHDEGSGREFTPNPSTLLLENIGNSPFGWNPFFRYPDQGEVRIVPNSLFIDPAAISDIKIGSSAYEDKRKAEFFHS